MKHSSSYFAKQRNTGNNIFARLCYHSPTSNKKTWINICNITRHTYPERRKTEIEREEGECNIPENLEAEKVWAFRERETRWWFFFFFLSFFLSEPFCELHFGMMIQWWMGSPKFQENYKRKKGETKKKCGEAAMKSICLCRENRGVVVFERFRPIFF